MNSDKVVKTSEEAIEIAKAARAKVGKIEERLIIESSKRHEVQETHSTAIKEHAELLQEIVKIQDRLTSAIGGDPALGIKGTNERLGMVEDETAANTAGMKRFYTIGGTLSVIWGGVVAIVSLVVSIFFGTK